MSHLERQNLQPIQSFKSTVHQTSRGWQACDQSKANNDLASKGSSLGVKFHRKGMGMTIYAFPKKN